MGKEMKPTRTNLVKRACDACKIRKIKCSETSPCNGCTASGIACTFRKLQATRGPRSLRAKTIRKISETQVDSSSSQEDTCIRGHSSDSSVQNGMEKGPRAGNGSDISSLLQALDVYRLRLYPIWPIIDVEKIRNGLVSANAAAYILLATAIRLATVAQLQGEAISPDDVPPSSLEHCDSLDLDGLRISFFLHIYHENKSPGNSKSLIYLRQALTLAQIMRLDREASYDGLPESEQEMRRRVLWLLFVTERGVAMLHKLPVLLKPNVGFPVPRGHDRTDVLPAFLKLVNLFWVFDQSGVFEILQNSDSDLSNMTATARDCLDLLQTRLQDSAADYEPSNDIQRADIFVTRQWMRAVLWRAAAKLGATLTINPVLVGREFLDFVSQLPQAALEAHGPTIEAKTYDIATAVIEAAASQAPARSDDRPEEVLQGLQRLLSSSRGGNKALLASLYFKMATMPMELPPVLPGPRIVEDVTDHDVQLVSLGSPSGPSMLPSAWADLEDILANSSFLRTPSGNATPNYHSIEQQNQQMSWAPLDFSTPLMRTPSPLDRVLFDHCQLNIEGIVPEQVWTEPPPP
ncbi:NADP-dependent oxidoreductase domain-containing protein [Apiospora kogelbergensis]|uniref:NADP-dependent oxidoreductase domain-containing protein n=1 Tax=Apiospora kogelbergensis TaxID=1337665 RepID=UPI003131607A